MFEHIAKTTASSQLPGMICTCVRGNNCLFQHVSIVYLHHSKREIETRTAYLSSTCLRFWKWICLLSMGSHIAVSGFKCSIRCTSKQQTMLIYSTDSVMYSKLLKPDTLNLQMATTVLTWKIRWILCTQHDGDQHCLCSSCHHMLVNICPIPFL